MIEIDAVQLGQVVYETALEAGRRIDAMDRVNRLPNDQRAAIQSLVRQITSAEIAQERRTQAEMQVMFLRATIRATKNALDSGAPVEIISGILGADFLKVDWAKAMVSTV